MTTTPFPAPTDVQPDRAAVLLAYLDYFRNVVVARVGDLDEPGQPGNTWNGQDPPTLERVLLHLVQEYARHAGHLDIVRELHDGVTGE